ncbi:hypothetical protein [Chondromyces crocatus]|uniref:hypothetical protein n=1 Tax=Chondromyces crocatus TaxID=52 RepID=UPI0012E2C818|nr:hypothetical protein [Chondromyces crocatus]
MKKGDTSREPERDVDLQLALRDTVVRLAKPVSTSEVRKALPRPYQRPASEITRQLDELVRTRRLFTLKLGKSLKYCAREPEALLRDAVLSALADGPLSRDDLTKHVKRVAPGYEKGLAVAFTSLLTRGEVREHPKVGTQKKIRYGLLPPDPAPYLAKLTKDLRALQKKLSAHGVTATAIHATLGHALGLDPPHLASPPRNPSLAAVAIPAAIATSAASENRAVEDEAILLAALTALAAREPPGALLSLRTLRALQTLPKQRFDEAVLRLSESGRVVLHHHDFPASLTEAEREELVLDTHGVHYLGIAPRRIH